MNHRGYVLYSGNWPQNVSKLAKYAVRLVEGEWKVTVLCEIEQGLRYLAVHERAEDVVKRVNSIKEQLGGGELGGTFYVNEYRHLIVPVKAHPSTGTTSQYYYAGRVYVDFTFEYEDKIITTKPGDLKPGDPWLGPRPGIPYILAAGGKDVYYKTPAISEQGEIRPRVERRVVLSKIIGSKKAREAAEPIYSIKKEQGGRFYVNEHGAIFTPLRATNENGIDYVFCGIIDKQAWFPEPPVPF
jgi:hypothetical protein